MIAHQTDIGGRVSGGNACDSTEIDQLALTIEGDTITADFTGTSPQCKGAIQPNLGHQGDGVRAGPLRARSRRADHAATARLRKALSSTK